MCCLIVVMASGCRKVDGNLSGRKNELHCCDDQVTASRSEVKENRTETLQLEVVQRVTEITRFLRLYRWIMDAYVSDFFVLDHWDKLLPSWRSFLYELSAPDLAKLLEGRSHDERRVWPLSLLCYKACVHKLSLDRRMKSVDNVDIPKLLGEKGKDGDMHDVGSEKSKLRTTADERIATQESLDDKESNILQAGKGTEKAEFMCGQYHDLYHVYRRHVKPKKQHEIYQLGQVIRKLSECCQCKQIVDIGAGLGHLSRLLTFDQGLKVTTVEATDGHAPKASTFDRQMNREIKKQKYRKEKTAEEQAALSTSKDEDQKLPSHVVQWIEPSVSMEEFLRILNSDVSDQTDGYAGDFRATNSENSSRNISEIPVTEKYARKRRFSRDSVSGEIMQYDKSGGETTPGESSSEDRGLTQIDRDLTVKKFVLCGLHACGNLTATILKLFVSCPQAVGLSSVGCCYMKLSCDGDAENTGYPMSKTLKSSTDHQLSYAAREMACHFVEAYTERLKENRPNLMVHSYRAALQQIILEKDPNFQKGAMKITVKKAEQMPFHRYAEVGLNKLGLDAFLSEAQLRAAQGQIARWRNVVAFYTLRLALAPVVETLILLDRQLYLWEHGLDSVLLPVFDPSVSPRNFVLLAKK